MDVVVVAVVVVVDDSWGANYVDQSMVAFDHKIGFETLKHYNYRINYH